MARFIFSYIFCVILLCLFMQKPLSLYLQNTYQTDFGVSALAKNEQLEKFGIFYEILKFINESIVQKFNPPKPQPSIARVVVKVQPVEQNLTEVEILTYDSAKNLEQNLTNLDQNLNLTKDEIVLKAGDEVLFIGDSIMQPIALHAKKLLSKKGVKTTDLSRHSTGLVNKKYFNWQSASTKELAQNTNIKLVIALLGANDPWGRTIDGRYQEFASEAWTQFYAKRVSEIYDVAKQANVRVLWLGVPCMKKQDYALKMRHLNDIFQTASKVYDQGYFATSDAVCADGNYTTYMKNDKGKSVKIRSDDGIHINMEGSRIVAARLLERIKVVDENSTK